MVADHSVLKRGVLKKLGETYPRLALIGDYCAFCAAGVYVPYLHVYSCHAFLGNIAGPLAHVHDLVPLRTFCYVVYTKSTPVLPICLVPFYSTLLHSSPLLAPSWSCLNSEQCYVKIGLRLT